MATNTTRMDPGLNTLVPYFDTDAHLEPIAFGASLTVSKGQAIAVKTADKKGYPLNIAATDGTQIFEGFSEYSFATDANGVAYIVDSGTAAGATVYTGQFSTMGVYTSGYFNPNDLFTSATGTPVAEVDTFTPASPTTGDINTVTTPSGLEASFVVAGTQTAAAVVTGLTNSWNSNPDLVAIGTPSGTGTFIVTAVNAGEPMNLTSKVVGTGTLTKVQTTAPVSAQQAEVDTFTLAGTIVTGDVYTATITYPNASTHTVTATVGATTTPTAVDALLIAAWNANPMASGLATASGTATFILTGATVGAAMSVEITSSGAGTIAKVVTKPALGRNLNDILAGAPGAHINAATGCWAIPN